MSNQMIVVYMGLMYLMGGITGFNLARIMRALRDIRDAQERMRQLEGYGAVTYTHGQLRGGK